MEDKSKKVGLIGLITMVIGSMIGGGIFNIPQNMAIHSALGPVLIAWGITGVGMLMLGYAFKTLSDQRPDLTTGIYAYAKEGFGRYVGFNAAWGYWISAAVGNVAFAVMVNDALGFYFPTLLNHGIETMIFGLVLIWFYNFVVLRGVEEATELNTISTIVKFIAILGIIGIMIAFFNFDMTKIDFWGEGLNLGSIGLQIKSPMLVTLWCFIGIEGAVIISARAKKTSDVGKATIIGFLVSLVLYMAICVLAFGIMKQPELAKLTDPSSAYVMKNSVGDWFIHFVNISILISVGGAWVAWTILMAQVPYAAAQDGVLPKIFARENKKGAPKAALYISSIVMSLFMVVVVTAKDVYMASIDIAGVMVLPAYVLSSMFLWKESAKSNILKDKNKQRIKALLIGVFSTIYCLWLVYAAGLTYVLMSTIFYAIGIYFFYQAHKEDIKQGKKIFTVFEKVLAATMIIGAIISIVMMVKGDMTL